MVDDIARLGYEIDSSQARTAAGDLDKLAAAAERAAKRSTSLGRASRNLLRDEAGRFMSAQAAADKYGAEIDALRAKYIPMYAASKQLAAEQDEIKRALELGAISAKQAGAAMTALDAKYAMTGAAAQRMGVQTAAANRHILNMGFQFQDIGMMLASGQNPFILAMQQGTQVAGIFNQLKMEGQSAFSALKGGLIGLINPTSLLTIGVIAGGAALVQWGMSALTAADDAKALEDRFDDLSGKIDEFDTFVKNASLSFFQLTDKFGELADEMQIAFDVLQRIEMRGIEEQFRDISSTVANQIGLFDKLKQSLAGYTGEEIKVQAIADTFDITSGHAYNLLENLNAIENARTFDEMAVKAADLLFIIEQTEGPIEDLQGPFAVLAGQLAELVKLAGQFNDELGGDASPIGRVRPRMRPMDLGAPELNGRGGGRGAATRRERELERFIESLMTEREVLEQWRTEQLELLNQYNEKELEALGGQNEAKLRLEQEYQEKMAELKQKELSHTLGTYSTIFGNMAQLFEAGGKKTFAIAKAFSVAQALVNSYRAYTEVLADPSLIGQPWLRTILAASTLGAGLAQVANIASTSFGGSGGGGARGGSSAPSSVSAPAKQDPERVVRISVQGERWMRDLVEGLLTQIYEATEDGTRVVVQR